MPGEGLVYVLVPCSVFPLSEKNVQVVRVYLWGKWLCAGVFLFMCDVEWYLHVGHIILSLVSCSSRRGICAETTVLVVLQKFTPRCFLYTKALYVNYYLHCIYVVLLSSLLLKEPKRSFTTVNRQTISF